MKLEYLQNGDYLIPNLTLCEQLEILMPTMIKAAGITQQLKTTDQIKWVGLMNIVKAQAEEINFTELIYR